MSETVSVTVPEAARRLGVSERTIWRRLRSGVLDAARDGRRVTVRLLDRAASETAAPYRAAAIDHWEGPGPWPYTPELVARHRAAVLTRRRAAGAEMDRLASLSRPDPQGRTAADYIRADRGRLEVPSRGAAADRPRQ